MYTVDEADSFKPMNMSMSNMQYDLVGWYWKYQFIYTTDFDCYSSDAISFVKQQKPKHTCIEHTKPVFLYVRVK